MATLVDPDVAAESRMELVRTYMKKKPCCIEPYFSKPFLQEVQDPADILPPSRTFGKLCIAFRNKVSNMELECNFARAVKMRQAGQGHAHNQASMVAKHISAEAKLSQRRLLACQEQPKNDPTPGAALKCSHWPHITSHISYHISYIIYHIILHLNMFEL